MIILTFQRFSRVNLEHFIRVNSIFSCGTSFKETVRGFYSKIKPFWKEILWI